MAMRHSKRLLSLLLAMLMVFGMSASGLAAAISAEGGLRELMPGDGRQLAELLGSVSDTQHEALKSLQGRGMISGLVGFTGEYELDGSAKPVSVIVEFVHNPAKTLQLDAAVNQGRYIPIEEAERIANSDHRSFMHDLEALMGSETSANSGASASDFELLAEYHVALNGVALTLPANMVTDLLAFESVQAVYPNTVIRVDPESPEDMSATGDRSGMYEGRELMDVNRLHEEGYLGQGTTVCIIDTGIDYNHPAFEGAFLTESPRKTDDNDYAEDLLEGEDGNLYFYGRNFHGKGNNGSGYTTYPNYPERPFNDPMETTLKGWGETSYPRYDSYGSDFATSHGTHVAGTVAARDTGDEGEVSALGIAPEASIYSYRVLGPYGMGDTAGVIEAIEYVDTDKPDVVNMSLGGGQNNPGSPSAVAVNNVMIANPGIVFVIASGNIQAVNNQPFTVGPPAVSSTAITVGNAVAPFEKVEVAATAEGAAEAQSMNLFYTDMDSEFVKDEPTGKWINTYGGLSFADADAKTYRAVILPELSGVSAIPGIGAGTREEFEAVKDEIAGNVVVLGRGSAFLTSMELALEYGAGMLILVDKASDTIYQETRGKDSGQLPFLAVENSRGLAFVEGLNESDCLFSFTDCETVRNPITLNGTSCIGPVSGTYDIAPDVVSHGTDVKSTVPHYAVDADEGDYSRAYARFTGTSMASPHVAGAVALLKNYSVQNGEGWDAVQIKARLMNTAYPLGVDYSVFEIGAGFVNVYAAAKADAYVTAENSKVYTNGQGTQNVRVDTGSLAFGRYNIGEDPEQNEGENRTLEASIFNAGAQAKTFRTSYVFNTTGVLISVGSSEAAGIALEMPEEITLAVGEHRSFDITMKIPSGMTKDDAGSHEGYVVLTNTENESEYYRVPFALYSRYVAPLMREDSLFLNKPVVTSGVNKHTDLSTYMDLYFMLDQTISGISYFLYDYETFDITNPNNGAMRGIISSANIYDTRTGTYLINSVTATGYFTEYILQDGVPVDIAGYNPIPEGRHILLVAAYSEAGDEYIYPLEFYVDDTPPELELDGLLRGDYNTVVVPAGTQSYTLTGNVYDQAAQVLADNGVRFKIWEEDGDLMPQEAGQHYNAVFANVGDGAYVKADVDENGDFELELDLSGQTLPAAVSLYAFDHYSVLDITGKSGIRSTEHFTPGQPQWLVAGNNLFGWTGTNQVYERFYLEEAGPAAKYNRNEMTVFIGESRDMTVLFNRAALDAGDSVKYFESADTDIVTVTKVGENSVTVTGRSSGSTTVTAFTQNGMQVAIDVTVPTRVIDGVQLNAGDYVYLGAMKHIESAADRNNPVYESTETPIAWRVMGSEVTGTDEQGQPVTDGYISTLSKYVLDVTNFGSFAGMYYSRSGAMTIKHYLNGGIYTAWGEEQFAEPVFWNNFSDSELEAVPVVPNDVAMYSPDGELATDYSYTVDDGRERFYLPWALEMYIDGGTILQRDNSLYWSASHNLSESNTYLYRHADASTLVDAGITATYKNGMHAPYWTETQYMEWTVVTVNNPGSELLPDELNVFPNMGLRANSRAGVRPISKIDPESVVFAYEITPDGGEGTIAPDGEFYTVLPNEDARYFKLAILGGNGGADIGSIQGIDRSYDVTAGEMLTIGGISAEGEFDLIAYKIVDESGNIVKYGEQSNDAAALEMETQGLEAGSYRAYAWPQRLNAINSHETGVVSAFDVLVVGKSVESLTLNRTEITLQAGQSFDLVADIAPVDVDVRELKWSTSDNSVAAVGTDFNGIASVLANSAGTAVIRVEARDGSGVYAECTVNVVEYADALCITDTMGNELQGLSMEPGDETTLHAKVLPEGFNAETLALTWATSNAGIVSVTDDGGLVAVAEGVSIISLAAGDGSGLFAACKVTVGSPEDYVPVNYIGLQPEVMMLFVGESDRGTINLHPENATIPTILWHSSNPNVASVDETGLVTGLSTGTASVTATSLDGGVSMSIHITVSREVTAVALPKKLNLYTGQNAALTPVISPPDGLVHSMDWQTSDSSVATVEEGVVTAVGAGSATVTLIVNGEVSAACEVTVTARTASVEIAHEELLDGTLKIRGKGESFAKTLSVLVDGLPADNADVRWTSDNPRLVRVDDNGVITPLASGKAKIRATSADGGAFDLITVAVEIPVESIEIWLRGNFPENYTNRTYYILNGQMESFVGKSFPEDATNKSVTWEVLEGSEFINLSPSSNGLFNVTALSPGVAKIRGTSVDNPQATAEFYVDVRYQASNIILTPEEAVIGIGETLQLEWEIQPENAMPVLVFEKRYAWYADDSKPESVSVDANGLVTGEEEGVAYVYARDPMWKASNTIRVVVTDQPALNVVAVPDLAGIEVDFGTAFENLELPGTVPVILDNDETAFLPVTWLKGDYDGDTAGTYTLEGELTPEGGILNPNGLKAYLPVTVKPEVRPIPVRIKDNVTQLVEKCAAYLPVLVGTPENPTEYDGAVAEFFGHTAVVKNGKATIYIPVSNDFVAGTYQVTVTKGDETGHTLVRVVPYDVAIWSPTVDVLTNEQNEKHIRVTFASRIGGNIKTAHGPVQVDNNVLTVTNPVTQSGVLVLKGVKYPDLFPSYSFTFTLPYTVS